MQERSTSKAIMLSAFVYPGAGQLYLKRYGVAAVLLVIGTVATVLVLLPVMATANGLAERVANGELSLGTDMVVELHAATVAATAQARGPGLALLACWLTGVVHAWLCGEGRALYRPAG